MTKNRTIQVYRGTTAQNDAYTGSAGEITMDTTTNTIRIHDGTTVGGHAIGGSTPGQQGTFNLFDFKWADHELSDMAWLRADTFSWQPGSTYSNAYNHLVTDVSGKSLTSETVAGTTVQFYLANDGHKICPANQESNVAAIYAATGVAWYYILDTANTRFKLPRTKFGFTGYRDTVGKYVEAGLPNITAENGTNISDTGTPTGAFVQGNRAAGNGGGEGSIYKMSFDASLSNSIYGNSTTVQPQATQMYLYFYVGEFTQTAIENTAGLNAELFNAKIDIANNSTVTASDVLNSVVTTTGITKSSSGYVKLGNGLIIQWVRQQGTQSQNQDVTLPTAFTSANSFTATATIFGTAESMYPVTIQAQTATTVQLHRYTGGLSAYYFNIIAIGY